MDLTELPGHLINYLRSRCVQSKRRIWIAASFQIFALWTISLKSSGYNTYWIQLAASLLFLIDLSGIFRSSPLIIGLVNGMSLLPFVPLNGIVYGICLASIGVEKTAVLPLMLTVAASGWLFNGILYLPLWLVSTYFGYKCVTLVPPAKLHREASTTIKIGRDTVTVDVLYFTRADVSLDVFSWKVTDNRLVGLLADLPGFGETDISAAKLLRELVKEGTTLEAIDSSMASIKRTLPGYSTLEMDYFYLDIVFDKEPILKYSTTELFPAVLIEPNRSLYLPGSSSKLPSSKLEYRVRRLETPCMLFLFSDGVYDAIPIKRGQRKDIRLLTKAVGKLARYLVNQPLPLRIKHIEYILGRLYRRYRGDDLTLALITINC